MSVKTMSVEEKIKRIEQSTSLNDVSLECLPPIQTDKYYFVSYSHKDYKLVYKDIFYLQQNGFSIWYDRGMEAGKSWKETAEKYIAKYNCYGIIFFLSENSILSDSIHEEIKLLVKNGKNFLTINLPINGKYMSAKEMLDSLIEKGIEVDDDKYELISKYLNEDVIYINYSSSYEEKIEKILSLKSSPLFKLNTFFLADEFSLQLQDQLLQTKWLYGTKNIEDLLLQINSINDIEIKEIMLKDFISSLTDNFPIEKLEKIGNSSLANCQKLISIELPQSIKVIGKFAFYNCQNLINIDLSNVYFIDNNAFENCSSLISVDLSSLQRTGLINDYTFKNCISLKEVILPKDINRIGKYAFENTKIKKLQVDTLNCDGIGMNAFYNCVELEAFSILNRSNLIIDKYAFSGCENLTNFSLPDGKIDVYSYAFEKCKKLIHFPFNLVNKIGFAAFSKCEGLTKLNLLGVPIGNFAFANCSNITEIIFNEAEKYDIGNSAFSKLTNLKKVVFAPGLTSIGWNTFENCINLETVYIPDNVEEMTEKTFLNCENLKEIYFSGTEEEFKKLMHKNFKQPWFINTGDYIVICKDKIISKYEFKK